MTDELEKYCFAPKISSTKARNIGIRKKKKTLVFLLYRILDCESKQSEKITKNKERNRMIM